MADHNEADIPLMPVPEAYVKNHPSKPHLKDLDEYHAMYKESIEDPTAFFGRLGKELLDWSRPYDNVVNGSLEQANVSWFGGGLINASYNCIDRHAYKNPDKIAIQYEADEPSQGYSLTYGELLAKVSQLAWVLKDMGVKKGDTVALYLPMIPEVVIAFLACTRIGAIHSTIFAGFSSDSLRDRINDAQSKVVITADEGRRGGKTIATKKIVDEALKQCPDVSHVLVYKRTGSNVPWTEKRDFWYSEETEKWPRYIAPEPMASESPLFLLYTSGSTGKPKGLMHSTAGYLLGCAMTSKYSFDLGEHDTLFCAGDAGWVTGHSYVIYGPLLLGSTTVVFEGTPNWPNFDRYWQICDKFNVSHFYCAPTALRLLKKAGDKHVTLKGEKLRVLGSVGEPIAAEVFNWYYTVVGKEKAHIIDTYWQTETGSHVITPMAGITPMKPGSACLPMFGIDPVILDPVSGEVIKENNVEGVLAFRKAWPSIARTIWRDHTRYRETYLEPYKGGVYFTGDGCSRDDSGYYWIRGRVDDVVNVSGHRISTAEIEAALLEHPECAAVGVSDELTGQALNAFVSLKDGYEDSPEQSKQLVMQVRKSIGPFAAPKAIYAVTDLPKTRSGKIMRRVLRKVLAGEEDSLGDLSTLSEPAVVENIIKVVKEARK